MIVYTKTRKFKINKFYDIKFKQLLYSEILGIFRLNSNVTNDISFYN